MRQKVETTAKKCHHTFMIFPGELKRGNDKFCSRKCYFLSKKGLVFHRGVTSTSFRKRDPRLVGEHNYNWKGGIVTIKKKERAEFRRTMNKKIFERDNYTCQICNLRGVKLHVDHIKRWSEFPELRFNMDNCRTLCQDCHYFITFGKQISKDTVVWGGNYATIR